MNNCSSVIELHQLVILVITAIKMHLQVPIDIAQNTHNESFKNNLQVSRLI